ncbi:hypothetical protein RHSIM_Rhsim09G0073900 [Rhododendron simsii]|uniref:Uncharacterized protein n=1 Tax=Rhododendron simsii TaxID=118357 RepID=A0A834GD86_RHOSS|nr:hypothetical protein RHSIM_Rhsim09G0073900 [Rhododendron simsii]
MSQEISQSVGSAMTEIQASNLHLTASMGSLITNVNTMSATMGDLVAIMKEERTGKGLPDLPPQTSVMPHFKPEGEAPTELEPLKQGNIEVEFQEAVNFMTSRKDKGKMPEPRSPCYSEGEDGLKPRRERKPKERVMEEATLEPPRQVKILKRPEPIIKKVDPG